MENDGQAECDTRPVPLIDPARCDGCMLCIKACPTGALAMQEYFAVVRRAERCEYSGNCERICPTQAITLPFKIVLFTQGDPVMATQSTLVPQNAAQLDVKAWAKLGLLAAAVAIVAVLLVQTIALALFPDIALFKPLDSYARSALFVLVPALGATALFAWLVNHTEKPVSKFIALSAIVLGVSIIPDFVLPDPYKTLLASAVTAFLHVVAGVIIVSILALGYQRQQKRAGA